MQEAEKQGMWWEWVLGLRDLQESTQGPHKVLRGSGMQGGPPKEQTVWLVGSLELFFHVPVRDKT